VQFIGHTKIFKAFIGRVRGWGYFYTKIYWVVTEYSLYSSYCHTKIFRIFVDTVLILYEILQS